MATPTDEKKWKSICTEVTTFMTTATPIEKQKLLIGIAKMNTRRYVHERNGRFQARISAFLKVRTIGTFPNREEATLAVAIVKMKLGPELGLKKRVGQYQKSTAQKLKESVPQPKRKNRKTEAQKLKESVQRNREAAEKKKKEMAARKAEREESSKIKRSTLVGDPA